MCVACCMYVVNALVSMCVCAYLHMRGFEDRSEVFPPLLSVFTLSLLLELKLTELASLLSLSFRVLPPSPPLPSVYVVPGKSHYTRLLYVGAGI